ncbi:lysozyme inhibitor LprI family protein [Colwellia sp. RE-S-Sl-9]
MRYILFLSLIPSILLAGGHLEKKVDYSEIHSVFQSMNCLYEDTEQKMDECGSKSLTLAKSRMNLLIDELLSTAKKVSQSRSDKIKKSQKDWALYTESNCIMETLDSEGGSGYPSIINFCYETKINERISYLQWILSNK